MHLSVIALIGFAVLPMGAFAQQQSAKSKTAPNEDNCLLNTSTDRWSPAGLPDIRRVSGNTAEPQIRYAGRIGDLSAYVTDFRCDYIAFEVTLVGPVDDKLSAFLSAFRKIEHSAGISNISRLSAADLVRLQNKGSVDWVIGREHGEVMLKESDLSILIRALYINRNY